MQEDEYNRRFYTVLEWVLNSYEKERIVNSGIALWRNTKDGCTKVQMNDLYDAAWEFIGKQAGDTAKKYLNKQLQYTDKLISQIPSETLKTASGIIAVSKLMEHQAKLLNLYKTTFQVEQVEKVIGYKDMKDQET